MQSVYQQMGFNLCIIDNGSEPALSLPETLMNIQFCENRFWTGGWNRAMQLFDELEYEWVWMLNSDVQGITQEMFQGLTQQAFLLDIDCLMVSPAFNSPHAHMQRRAQSLRRVRWIDMCAPLVNVQRFLSLKLDEDFIGYGADLDLCKRAEALGYKMYVTDNFCFTHTGGDTAVSEGVSAHTDIALMNRLLKEKHGVDDWSQMFSGGTTWMD